MDYLSARVDRACGLAAEARLARDHGLSLVSKTLTLKAKRMRYKPSGEGPKKEVPAPLVAIT